mmetsp:Transcript_3482/g.5120  ORF Transcript_3482/g.5120 Transcript_3482/m.5120 type:complete len:325 (+) Transcript_3482:57-1031(+)
MITNNQLIDRFKSLISKTDCLQQICLNDIRPEYLHLPLHSKTGKENSAKNVSYISQLAILPPPDSIQDIKEIFGVSSRLGPHITLSFPFLHPSSFSQLLPNLEKKLQKIHPFEISLNPSQLSYFKHGPQGHYTLLLKIDSDEIHSLYNLVSSLFPETISDLDHDFIAHLSLDTHSTYEGLIEAMESIRRSWKGTHFKVSSIYALSRSGLTPFKIRHILPLKNAITEPYISIPLPLESPIVLYVGKLPRRLNGIHEHDLLVLFQKYNPIQSKVLRKNERVNRSKGFGFVQFSSSNIIETILNDHNTSPFTYEGKQLILKEVQMNE